MGTNHGHYRIYSQSSFHYQNNPKGAVEPLRVVNAAARIIFMSIHELVRIFDVC
ncbi:MAG: hypothetical protein ACI9HB_002860, partial [Gammaproteobacteria bacterium]